MTLETLLSAALFIGLFVTACWLIAKAPKQDASDDDDPWKWGW